MCICIYTTLYVTILSFLIHAYPECGASEHAPTMSMPNNMNFDDIPVDIITMFTHSLQPSKSRSWREHPSRKKIDEDKVPAT